MDAQQIHPEHEQDDSAQSVDKPNLHAWLSMRTNIEYFTCKMIAYTLLTGVSRHLIMARFGINLNTLCYIQGLINRYIHDNRQYYIEEYIKEMSDTKLAGEDKHT